MEHTHSTPNSNGNPRAAVARLETRLASAYEGQRRHDIRSGPQPAYIDADRLDLNDVLIEPPRPQVLRQINESRRNQRDTKRKMKSDAALAIIGILAFGSEAHGDFIQLTREQQNAAFTSAAEDIAGELNTTLAGLVVHRDETSTHAHFTFPAFNNDGFPISKEMNKVALQRIQTITAAAFKRYVPTIERGNDTAARAAAGASNHDLRHRSVKQLHADLPHDLKAAQDATRAAQEKADEMAARVARLEEKEALSITEMKRLNTYRKRLEERVEKAEAAVRAAVSLAQLQERIATEAKEAAAIHIRDAEQAKHDAEGIRTAAEEDAAATRAEATKLRDTLKKTIGSMRVLAKKVGLTGPDAISVQKAITTAETVLHREENEIDGPS